MSWGAKLKEREKAEDKPCTCWDCLRAAGITPDRSMRDKFPRFSPFTVFQDDPGGDPQPRKKKDEDAKKPTEATEQHQLREAIRNREVI